MKVKERQKIHICDHLLRNSRKYSNNVKIKSKQKLLNSKRWIKAAIVILSKLRFSLNQKGLR